MTVIALQAIAAMYLLYISFLFTAYTAWGVVWAKLLPFSLGSLLAAFALAQFMGWPLVLP